MRTGVLANQSRHAKSRPRTRRTCSSSKKPGETATNVADRSPTFGAVDDGATRRRVSPAASPMTGSGIDKATARTPGASASCRLSSGRYDADVGFQYRLAA